MFDRQKIGSMLTPWVLRQLQRITAQDQTASTPDPDVEDCRTKLVFQYMALLNPEKGDIVTTTDNQNHTVENVSPFGLYASGHHQRGIHWLPAEKIQKIDKTNPNIPTK